MKKVVIHILDTNKYSFDELENSEFMDFDFLTSITRMKNEVAKKEKAASNILKNKYIGDYEIDANGKPVSDKCFFNISHDCGFVALAISEEEVGVDIEQLRKMDSKLLNYAFNAEEREKIKSSKAFFAVWTNKEALCKCNGVGIRMKMNEVPGLPVNGLRTFKGEKYYSRTIAWNNFIVSVAAKQKDRFDVEIVEEKL